MKLDDFYISSYVFQRDKNNGELEKSKKYHTRGARDQKVSKRRQSAEIVRFGQFLSPQDPCMKLFRFFEFTTVLIALVSI